MGIATMIMRVAAEDPRQLAEDVVAKLKDRFNEDDGAEVDLLFNPEDRSEFQIRGRWRDVDTARKAVDVFDDLVGDVSRSGAKVDLRMKSVFTSKPL